MIGEGLDALINTNVNTVDGKVDTIDTNVDTVQAIVLDIIAHMHADEKWFGDAAVSAAETHHADRVNGVILPFTLAAGASAFNAAWTQILGSDDTPVIVGNTHIDGSRLLVTATNDTAPFVIQFVTGESVGIAAKIGAEDFTEVMYIAATAAIEHSIDVLFTRAIAVGTKLWARCACVGQDAKLIDFYIGFHEH